MSSVEKNIISIPLDSLKNSFSDAVRTAKTETIKEALFAIQSQESETLSNTLSNRNIGIVEDLSLAALLNPIFKQNSAFLEEIQNSGFETVKDFALHELSQELWDRTACVVDRKSEWIQPLILGPTEKESIAIENPIECLHMMLQDRLQKVRSVEKAIEIGWLQTDQEDATEQQRTLWQQQREDWPAKIATWEVNCQKLINKMRNNEKQELFAEAPEDRKKQYIYFATEMARALPVLAKENKDYDFYDTGVPYILESCRVAWEEFTEQLGDRAGFKLKSSDNFFVQIAQTLRNLRENILLNHVLPAAIQTWNPEASKENVAEWASNVHYKKSIKQWANAQYHLEISAEKLGSDEILVEILSPVFKDAANKIMAEHYSAAIIAEEITAIYNKLSKKSRLSLVENLVNSYKENIITDKAPCIDRLESLKNLYYSLRKTEQIEDFEEYRNTLKNLHQRWVHTEFVPPFSAMTPKELAIVDLQQSPFGPNLMRLLERKENLRNIFERKDISPEQKAKLEVLISTFEKAESPEAKSSYLLKQKKRIKEVVSELNSQIAIKNKELLKKAILSNTEELTKYGALFLAATIKILSPVMQEENPAQQVLKWAKENFSESLLESTALRLIKVPADYLSLPEELKNTPFIQALVESNPGLKYGLDQHVYSTYINAPNKADLFANLDPIAINIAGFKVLAHQQVF